MPENLVGSTTTGYSLEFAHTRNEGIVGNPVGGVPPQNASLVRLYAPIEFLTVFWSGSCEGAPPILPSSKSYFTNQNRVLVAGGRYGVVTPTLGGHIWEVCGFFKFIVVGPEGLNSDFPLSVCPWEGTAATDFYIPAANFQTGIINPNSPPACGGLKPDPDVPLLQNPLG
jgi:hypothetical protein